MASFRFFACENHNVGVANGLETEKVVITQVDCDVIASFSVFDW